MKNQVVYDSNLDYEATYQALLNSKLFIVELTPKGMIWTSFKDTKTIFMVFPSGKIQVLWKSLEEKKVLLNVFKNLLVPRDGEVWIKPCQQQITIPYPPPEPFKLYWCEEETEYVKQTETDKALAERIRLETQHEEENLEALRNTPFLISPRALARRKRQGF